MNEQTILELGRDTLAVAAMMAGPLLLVGLTTGLVISVLQTVTSIQEQTLTFVPKIAAVMIAAVLLMPWLLRTLCRYTAALLGNLHRFGA